MKNKKNTFEQIKEGTDLLKPYGSIQRLFEMKEMWRKLFYATFFGSQRKSGDISSVTYMQYAFKKAELLEENPTSLYEDFSAMGIKPNEELNTLKFTIQREMPDEKTLKRIDDFHSKFGEYFPKNMKGKIKAPQNVPSSLLLAFRYCEDLARLLVDKCFKDKDTADFETQRESKKVFHSYVTDFVLSWGVMSTPLYFVTDKKHEATFTTATSFCEYTWKLGIAKDLYREVMNELLTCSEEIVKQGKNEISRTMIVRFRNKLTCLLLQRRVNFDEFADIRWKIKKKYGKAKEQPQAYMTDIFGEKILQNNLTSNLMGLFQNIARGHIHKYGSLPTREALKKDISILIKER